MTAVFAMVRGDALFVAGDTRRGSGFSLCVQKVHSWGDRVILGQSGNGRQQSALIADLKLGRQTEAQRDEPDFHALYAAKRPAHLATIAPPARTNGTLLVAALDPATGTGALLGYDFASGSRTPLPRLIAASGTDAVALTAIAEGQERRLSGGTIFPLDEWAWACVADAVNAFPDHVGWPCDMIVSRASPAGGRLITERRIDDKSAIGLPEFAV